MAILVKVSDKSQVHYAESICNMIQKAAQIRGTGIAERDPEYVKSKIEQGKAIIALDDEKVIGFCYVENWEGKKYVANSGLIVHPDYRKTGLAKRIKMATFNLSKDLFPEAKLFGITTSMAVMKINSDLGYKPVTFSEITKDTAFWAGCKGCVNYDVLERTNRTMCFCTGMVCDLSKIGIIKNDEESKSAWQSFRQFISGRKKRLQQKIKKFPILKIVLKNEK